MKNSTNGCKLFLNAQRKQQSNAQSQMQSASECNHSIGSIFQRLSHNVCCSLEPQWSSNDCDRANHSNTVPWPMHFGQWPHSLKDHIIYQTIYQIKAFESRSVRNNAGYTCAITHNAMQLNAHQNFSHNAIAALHYTVQ